MCGRTNKGEKGMCVCVGRYVGQKREEGSVWQEDIKEKEKESVCVCVAIGVGMIERRKEREEL